MKIKFVQLESQAFFTDLDFITMSAAERGVYCTLLLHLYCNAGRCEFDPQALARLSNCDDFEKVWEKVAKKFQTRNGSASSPTSTSTTAPKSSSGWRRRTCLSQQEIDSEFRIENEELRSEFVMLNEVKHPD
jgi:uncharacterized protein YdaU (DUF1376 family)